MPLTLSNKVKRKSDFRPGRWRLGLLLVLLLIVFGCLWAVTHVQQLRDWYVLSTYKPPSSISSLASEDTMTPYARMLFFVNRPQLETKSGFAQNCPSGSDQAYVIGCYHSGDRGIYLLNVTDNRLNGIVPVTAAYEMLHAGYARLSNQARNTLDKQMWSFFISSVKSTEIRQQMASYEATEPGAKYDELYSVLGTEVAALPPSLNQAYSEYFTDRTKIVMLYDGYQAAFSLRQNQIASDDLLLAKLKSVIDSNQASLNSMYSIIIKNQTVLNQDRAVYDISAYDAGVNQYNALVNQYNSLIRTTQAEINNYNDLVSKRNSLVLIEQQLTQDLNTSKLPSSIK